MLENTTLMVEPAFEPENDTHVIYEGQELLLPAGTCGHGHNISTVSHTSVGGLTRSLNTGYECILSTTVHVPTINDLLFGECLFLS